MPQEEGLSVLTISPLEEDHVALGSIIRQSSWSAHRAFTCQQGRALLREIPIAVVICEQSLPDGSWKDILGEVAMLPDPPLLIVASRLADHFLWAEVLNLGGYDVLAKPFDPREVFWAIGRAGSDRNRRREQSGHAG